MTAFEGRRTGQAVPLALLCCGHSARQALRSLLYYGALSSAFAATYIAHWRIIRPGCYALAALARHASRGGSITVLLFPAAMPKRRASCALALLSLRARIVLCQLSSPPHWLDAISLARALLYPFFYITSFSCIPSHSHVCSLCLLCAWHVSANNNIMAALRIAARRAFQSFGAARDIACRLVYENI